MKTYRFAIRVTLTENQTVEHTYTISEDEETRKQDLDKMFKPIADCFGGSSPVFVLLHPSYLYVKKYVKCIAFETIGESEPFIEEVVEQHIGFPTPNN